MPASGRWDLIRRLKVKDMENISSIVRRVKIGFKN